MNLLVGWNMGNDGSRDRWLVMEKTQYHSLRCSSGPIGSIQLVLGLSQQHAYGQRGRQCATHQNSMHLIVNTTFTVFCVVRHQLARLKCLR